MGPDIENFTVFSNLVKHPLQELRDGCKKTKRKYRLTGKEKGIRYTLHRLSERICKISRLCFQMSYQKANSTELVSSFYSFKEKITLGDKKTNHFSTKV